MQIPAASGSLTQQFSQHPFRQKFEQRSQKHSATCIPQTHSKTTQGTCEQKFARDMLPPQNSCEQSTARYLPLWKMKEHRAVVRNLSQFTHFHVLLPEVFHMQSNGAVPCIEAPQANAQNFLEPKYGQARERQPAPLLACPEHRMRLDAGGILFAKRRGRWSKTQ